MMNKLENLRKLIGEGMLYEELEQLCYRNDLVPSISYLRSHKLLKVVREELLEDVLDDEEIDYLDEDEKNDYNWDDEREMWVWQEKRRYYGI